MEQYYADVRRELERHGGTVEKFIGDAAMAVFGMPTVHDDDALRAVRAAVDMRTALGGLNHELEETHGVRLAIRTGVNTGEVVAGDPTDRQSFATGDAVATAQRLEAAARSGEILLGDSTYRLVSNAVLVEPMDRLELKGKAEPVRAWRLLGVVEGAPPFPRRLDSPLVGRERELAALETELDAADRERRCRLATIVGPAGIGKSRLGNESSRPPAAVRRRSWGAASPTARGSRSGRCAGSSCRRQASLTQEGIAQFLEGAEDADRIAEQARGRRRLRGGAARRRGDVLGRPPVSRALARERPIILGIDELQWAEPTFLDLLEYLVGWTTRRTGSPPRPRAARAAGAPADLEHDQLARRCARAALRATIRSAWSEALGGGGRRERARADPRRRGGQSAVRRADARACGRGVSGRGDPTDDPGAARRPPRPAGRGRAGRSGAGRRRSVASSPPAPSSSLSGEQRRGLDRSSHWSARGPDRAGPLADSAATTASASATS